MEITMEKFDCRLVKALLCVIVWVPLMAWGQDDPWYATQPSCVIEGADPGRTREYKAEGIEQFNNIVWRTAIENANPDLDLLCYEDKIFFGNKGYDEKTGKLVWEISELQKYHIGRSIIYKGHMYLTLYLYHQGQHSRKYMGIVDINIATKSMKMLNMPIETEASPGSMLAFNEMLFTSSATYIFAYSLKTNQVLWRTAAKNRTGVQLATDGERLFAEYKNRIAAYDIKTGKPQWIYNESSQDIIYKNGMVYTECMGGVWALNSKTGKVIWHYIPDNMDEDQFLPNQLHINEKNIYFTSANGHDGNLYSLDRLTGKLNFKIHGLARPVLHADALYVDDISIPYYENIIKVLNEKDRQLYSIKLPISGSYEFPKGKNLLFYEYVSKKKTVILTLIN